MVKHRATAFGVVLALALAQAAAGHAETPAWPDPGWRETTSRIDVEFDRSGLSDTVQAFELKAVDEAGARAIAGRRCPSHPAYPTTTIEARATDKADGRVIPVDFRAVKD